jgi:hypothetical protein
MTALTLSGSIVESLKAGEMISALPDCLLSRNRTRVLRHDETEYWDYKRELYLDTPSSIARVAKDILAFHNTKGGVLIIGIDDRFRAAGVPKTSVLDTYQVQEKLRKYIGPEVRIFRDTIDLSQDRVLWLLFVGKRKGLPAAVVANGPLDKSGRPEIRQNEYYIRLHDQSILCTQPSHQERLWTGASIDHLQAYLYDIDEPYFRLLAPNCDQFVGRRKKLAEINDVLIHARQPVVSLEGLGGVGKSAVAIELVRQFYESRSYLFIVSQSAKSKVWQDGYVGSRRAGFSGLREFLLEIAKVLDLNTPENTEVLKEIVIESMSGLKGLLLVDNIEDVLDQELMHFLKRDIPEPVKVLVTSRIDRAIGAYPISIPQLEEFEARELLYHELERLGYTGYINEESYIDDLLTITGKLPLALKWSAAVAAKDGLKEAVEQLRKVDITKKAFLNFLFATMYETLSPLARDAALISPYIGEDWNALSVSMILKAPEDEVEDAIRELKDRGILLTSSTTHADALLMLPLTKDFLAGKFKENKALRDRVDIRIAELFASPNKEVVLNWPRQQRIDLLYRSAEELKANGNFDRAGQMIRLALKWSDPRGAQSSDAQNQISRLQFLQGTVLYEAGQMKEGLWNMEAALKEAPINSEWAQERIYFAQALHSHGQFSDKQTILTLLKAALPLASKLTRENVEVFRMCGKESDVLDLLNHKLKHSTAYWLMKTLEARLSDRSFIFSVGRPLMQALRSAASSEEATAQERKFYLGIADDIAKQYKHLETENV